VYYSNLYVDFKADTEKNINSWDDLVVADE